MKPPGLDKRTYSDIVGQALQLAREYFPKTGTGAMNWNSIHEPVKTDDPAYRMLEIFARLVELLIHRINKIPVKNFLGFLEMVGVEQRPGNPAEVPVTFLPAGSALHGGEIPKGTQVATTQTDTADAQVFETRETIYATPAKLKKVVNLIPGVDSYSTLQPIPLPPTPQDLEDDTGVIAAFDKEDPSLSRIEHVLYLGSEALFGEKETVRLELEIHLSGDDNKIFNDQNLIWKTYNDKNKSWEVIKAKITYTNNPTNVVVTMEGFTGTAKSGVNGIEDFWIACCFKGEFKAGMPVVEKIEGKVLPIQTVNPKIDSAFANNTPIDLSKPFYPFGQRPQYGDAFYIGSKKAFAPDVQSVTLEFTIHPYSDADIKEMYRNLTKATDKTGVEVVTSIEWQYLAEDDTWKSLETFKHSLKVTAEETKTTVPNNVIQIKIYRTGDKDGTLFGDGKKIDIQVTFPGFPGISLNELNQKKNYWLRALVKTFNPYGKDAWLEPTGDPTQPYVVIGPTFIPPLIEKARVKYTYKPGKPDFRPVDAIQTKNNFEITVPKGKFTPFIPITSHIVGNNSGFFAKEPALYMGFDRAFGDVYTGMFFQVKDIPVKADLSAADYALEQGNPQITWEYAAAGDTWKPLDVEDKTANLTAGGTVSFIGPLDSIKINLFKYLTPGDEPPDPGELYWYRARLANGCYQNPPRLKAIYLNTVMADNRVVSREDQVIGTGNGSANQKLYLVRVPVIGGQLWVREVEKPGKEVLENLLQDFRQYGEYGEELEQHRLFLEIDRGDGETENWVQWLKVPNFISSGPRSRHYTLDAVNGEITFGNGENGMIPPVGKDNIIIKQYCTSGGEKANTAAFPLAVNVLKSSLPYIEKVFNVQNAAGGSNPWTLDDTMQIGPQSVKHRDRAVTTEDYEWMVLQNFSQVARARCIPNQQPAAGNKLLPQPGAVTVIIIPKSKDRKPQPPKGLLKNTREFLAQKALGTIIDDIHVIGPGFEKIDITAGVIPVQPEESSNVERRIVKNLEDFFHPLTGGEEGQGWNFGRNVYKAEIYAVIQRIEGVRHVKNVTFTGQPDKEFIEIKDNYLPYSGNHTIKMEAV